MGKLICVADPDEAAARARRSSPPTTGPHRHPAVPADRPRGDLAGSPCAGELFIQAEVEADGRQVRFDDAVGAGWRLVTLAEPALDPDLAEWFATIGGAAVALGCGDQSPRDVDRTYRAWFAGPRRRGGVAATGLLTLRHGGAGGG